jgi:hypothetical protein
MFLAIVARHGVYLDNDAASWIEARRVSDNRLLALA